jgi:hypothetical protein
MLRGHLQQIHPRAGSAVRVHRWRGLTVTEMVRAPKGSPPFPTRRVREKPAESAIQDGGGRDLLLLRQYRLAVAGACRYLRSRYQPSMVRMCWPGSESAPRSQDSRSTSSSGMGGVGRRGSARPSVSLDAPGARILAPASRRILAPGR